MSTASASPTLARRYSTRSKPSLQARITALIEGCGLFDERGQSLGSYSRGMRQKALIAAALIHDPSLIVLDAPLNDGHRLDVLGPICAFCRARGYHEEGKSVRVGAWPVQFVPVFSPLTLDALNAAETADFEGVPFRVVGAAHLAVIGLSAGRAKGFARVLALLDGAVTREAIGRLAGEQGLSNAWDRFVRMFLDDRECATAAASGGVAEVPPVSAVAGEDPPGEADAPHGRGGRCTARRTTAVGLHCGVSAERRLGAIARHTPIAAVSRVQARGRSGQAGVGCDKEHWHNVASVPFSC
jgi:hypothetical protein